MGAVQITIGFGFIVRAHLVPVFARVFSTAPATEPGALALPNARAVTLR
jgi:hypothetical protein